MSDTINRQDVVDALIRESIRDGAYGYIDAKSAVKIMRQLPSAEQNHRICRNCKEAKFYGNVDKNGNVECIWLLKNWKKQMEANRMRLIDADKLLQDIKHYNLSDGKFQHWVEIQPTFELEPHWSPCSERPPEVNDTYIVCYEDASVLMDWFNGYWFFYQTNSAIEETGTIIAWMSLPEPYQPEEEKTE